MNRAISLLVVIAVVNVTLGRAGHVEPGWAYRAAPYRALPAPKPGYREVGNGYGMGRYARGAGAGGGSLIYEMASKIAHTRLNLNEFL